MLPELQPLSSSYLVRSSTNEDDKGCEDFEFDLIDVLVKTLIIMLRFLRPVVDGTCTLDTILVRK